MKNFLHLLTILLILCISATAGDIHPTLQEKVKTASVMEKIPIIIYLNDQVDLNMMEDYLKSLTAPNERVPNDLRYRTVITALMDIAEQTQPQVVSKMQSYVAKGDLSDVQRLWIQNMIVVKATPQTIEEISKWEEVQTVFYDGFLERERPVYSAKAEGVGKASEAGLRAINAHRLWALGYTGAGRLVMNIDTGVNGNNLAFNTRWRGTLPGVQPGWAWHDPANSTTFPVDGDASDNHGTHTMGTMCGVYTATGDTIGVAPGAYWIASNSLIGGSPHTSRSIAAFQWAANPDGNINTMNDVPDVVSCSWFDPNITTTECSGASGYWGAVDALEALGSAVVWSAGNSGPGVSTITSPKNRNTNPVNFYTVGALDGNTAGYPIASFSSRGPSKCTAADSLMFKPEVSAPGVNVRSAFGTNSFRTLSGTSMASPHVAGSIALLKQIAPFMTGTELKYILMNTAIDMGTAGEDNTFGKGMIDLWRAYLALPLNMGYVKGNVTTDGSPLQNVQIDFVQNIQQLTGSTNVAGGYKVGARVDTPFTSQTFTLRGQKFGFVTYTDSITIVVNDTATRNITMVRVNDPMILVNKSQISFSPTPVYGLKTDSILIQNEGGVTLDINSIATTNPDYSVSQTSALILSGSSLQLYITYSPQEAGADTGRVIISSNAGNLQRIDVTLSGTGVGTPIFLANVSSLQKSVEGGTTDSILFKVRNVGTASGNYLGQAVMYRRTAKSETELLKSRRVLLVSDNPALLKTEVDSDKGSDTGIPPAEGVSSSLIYRALVDGGYSVDTVAFATHSASIYPTYDLVIWATGANSATTLFNDAAKRTALIQRVQNGGKVWVEGGEVGYRYRWQSSAEPDPLFRRTVLRDSNWLSDVTTSNLIITNATHQIFTTPNQINSPVLFTGTNIYSRDAMRLLPGDTRARKIAGWSFYSVQGPDTASIIISEDNGMPVTVFTAFAFGSITDTNVAKRLAQNIANALVGTTAPWLSIQPRTGTMAIGDSVVFTAGFNATDPLIYNEPGNYYGRIQITATNSIYADSLNIPANMFVVPPSGSRLAVDSASLNFGNVPISDTKIKSILVRNIGLDPLVVTNINLSNPLFSVSNTNFTLASLESLRVNVLFTPNAAGAQTASLSFVSNDPMAPSVVLRGNGVAVARIIASPDSIYFVTAPLPDTLTQILKIKNPGYDALNFVIDEIPIAGTEAILPPPYEHTLQLPKDVLDTRRGDLVTDGRGGPDAFGYTWIDSDEPGGPTYNWFDISTVGTLITTWSGTADDGYSIVSLPFTFNFYGNNYSSVKVVTNGFLSFDVASTNTSFGNTAIPATAEPNNGLYAWWDDLDLSTSGTVRHYNDAANNRFIVQYTNVPHYGTTEPGVYTFQILIYRNGEIVYQYQNMQQTLISATIGIENRTGTIASQVVFNQNYIKNNHAILFTRDLYRWLSTSVTQGSIAAGDSQNVIIKATAAGLNFGMFNGKLRISGNSPDVAKIPVTLNVLNLIPYITVTHPNGSEILNYTQSYNITWIKNIVDLVRIEYSTDNGTSWSLIAESVSGNSYPWLIPFIQTNQALVRISDMSDPTLNDVSNNVFMINIPKGSIAGTKFNDINMNGEKDAGEPAIANWKIYITGDVLDSLLTNSSGNFTFSNLIAGNYTIHEEMKSGWVQTFPTTGTHIISLDWGANVTSKDFGNFRLGSISGFKFEDVNGNNIWDTNEPALQGWTININGPLYGSSVTNMEGYYEFSGLTFGSYSITENPQSGWVQTLPASGSYNLNIISGANISARNFGNFKLGKITGIKFEDTNGNGIQDSGETGKPGWKIRLTGSAVDSVITDQDGKFTFNNLPKGNYTVGEDLQSNWMRTKPADPGTYALKIDSSRQTISGIDFGNFKYGFISGIKFWDRNKNGVKEIDEPGLSEWEIKLTGSSSPVVSTFTNSVGGFVFTNLVADSYTLTETMKPQWLNTAAPSPFIISSGSAIENLNFGNFFGPDSMQFRTFVPESLVALDAKGKIPKATKRKANKVEFKFDLTTPMNATGGQKLTLEFSMVVTGRVIRVDNSQILGTINWKKGVVVFSPPLAAGTQIRIEGFGHKGKLIQTKYAFGLTKYVVNTYLMNQLRLPMPTYANIINELFLSGAFHSTNGVLVGTAYPDFPKDFGWVKIKNPADVQKSLRDKGGIHTNSPKFFDIIGTKPFKGEQKVLPPTKHNNKLFAEIVAAKLALTASAAERIPGGLGELLYHNPTNPLHGKMVKEIVNEASASMTSLIGDAMNYYTVIRQINEAFSGKLDSVSFAESTKLTAVRNLGLVPYLRFNPNAQIAKIELNDHKNLETPYEFELAQNYPNPFNPSTTIEFSIPEDAIVTLKVYNILGQEVATLADREFFTEGMNEVTFDAWNLSSGVYFYSINVEGAEGDAINLKQVKKMLLLK